MNIAFLIKRFSMNWKKCVLFSTFFIILSWLYIDSIPKEFESDAVLKVNSFYKMNNSVQSSLGGLSNLVGLNTAGSGGDIDSAIAFFYSRDFQYELIKKYAIDDYFLIPKNISVDDRLDRTFRALKNKLSLTQDKKMMSIYRVNFRSYDSEFSQMIAINSIRDLNQALSKIDSQSINKRIQYIDSQIDTTASKSIINSFASILENDVKKLILIDSSPNEYIFEFIGLPYESINKIYPSRALLLLLSVFILVLSFPAYYIIKLLVIDLKKQIQELRG